MSRKRITYRPSKGQGVFGIVFGAMFILIGIFVAIPNFGLFGLLWTGIAVGITVMNAVQAFGKKNMGPRIEIEEDPSAPQAPPVQGAAGLSPQDRLEQLETLKEAGLLTEEEYRAKRTEILEQL